MPYQETFQKNISTNSTSKPNSPQVEIQNPFDTDIFINLFDLMPDAGFSAKGKLEILINDVSIFDQTKSDSLRRVKKLPLLSGGSKILRGGESIRIFAWNGTDSSSIIADVSVNLGIENNPIASSIVPLSQDETNVLLSDFESIFPNQARSPASYYALLDMKGYKKLTVMISAVSYLSGFTVLNNDYGNQVKDGDLSTLSAFTGGTQTGGIGVRKTFEVDFGSIASRPLVVKATVSASGGTSGGTPHNGIGTTTKISVKNNIGDAWTDLQTTVITATDGQNIVDQNVGYNQTQTFRYAKFDFIIDYGYVGIAHVTATVKLYELYESGKLGGQGSVSTEIQNSLGEWLPDIPSSEFGTVSFLGQSIQKQIGDTNNVSVSGKTYAIPSHPTKYRMKYLVENATITNAVDIMRVA